MSLSQPLVHAGKSALSAAQAVAGAGGRIVAAVEKAAASTGVDFAYLMEKAAAESSFDATAKAKTSSATGLYQFIESTWLEMVEKHGAKHGLAREANALASGEAGRAERGRILALRNDPALSAAMAAEFTRENRNHLEETVGGNVGNTELYLAHFLGAGGAEKFLKAHSADPNRPAAMLLPEAAAANRAVFFDGAGRMRSLADIYNRFDKRFEDGETPMPKASVAATVAEPQALAALPPMPAPGTNAEEDTLPLLKPLRIGPPSSGEAVVSSGLPRGIVLSPVTMLAMAELTHDEPVPRSSFSSRKSDDEQRWTDTLWRSGGLN